jgi:hypothetical protein
MSSVVISIRSAPFARARHNDGPGKQTHWGRVKEVSSHRAWAFVTCRASKASPSRSSSKHPAFGRERNPCCRPTGKAGSTGGGGSGRSLCPRTLAEAHGSN